MNKTGALFLFLCALLSLTTGCLHLVEIKDRDVTVLNASNMPVSISAQGTYIRASATVSGATQTYRYDSIVWQFARLPCIRSSAGFLVMLDTGMEMPGHMTIDLAAAQGYPAHLGEPIDFAYVPSLKLDAVTLSDLLVLIETNRYEAHFFGFPLYRLSGLALGMASLGNAKYLAFDNDRHEVTIGLEPFTPRADYTWESFPFLGNANTNLIRLPYVELPIAGTPVRLLADSAGGPRLILNAQQWKDIAPRMKVIRHRSDRYPTWGGFQEVDSYEVAELELGPLKKKGAIIWVRRGEVRETAPLLGLGVLGNATAVWDFSSQRFWIGTR